MQKSSKIRFRSLTKVWSGKKFLSLVFSFTHTYSTSDTRCVLFPLNNQPILHQLDILQFDSDTNWHYCRPHCFRAQSHKTASHFRHQSQVPGTSGWLVLSSPGVFLGFDTLLEAHGPQEKSLLTRPPIYHKRIQLKNNQMEEMPRKGHRESGGSSANINCPLQVHHFPNAACVHPPGSSPDP